MVVGTAASTVAAGGGFEPAAGAFGELKVSVSALSSHRYSDAR